MYLLLAITVSSKWIESKCLEYYHNVNSGQYLSPSSFFYILLTAIVFNILCVFIYLFTKSNTLIDC